MCSRAVEVALAARAGDDGEVVLDLLPGRRARQHAVEGGQVFERRDHLLDAGDRDVHLRQRGHHAAVALVGDDRDRAGLGHQEVAARDAEVGAEKMPAQHLARLARERLGVGQARAVVVLGEQVRDLLLVLVDRRRDDVRRRLLRQLDDVLAQVGLDRRDAGSLERLVQPRLLRHHRFRLDRFLQPVAGADLEHMAADFGLVLRPQHGGAVARRLLLEAQQPGIEVGQPAVADRRARARAALRTPRRRRLRAPRPACRRSRCRSA